MAHGPIRRNNYAKWTRDELRIAESTAAKFLEDNQKDIAQSLRTKIRCLELLAGKLNSPDLALDERLDCFAQISEIAEMTKSEADGFFELASQPVVAGILANLKRK
jgi:hypothetical protein